MRVPSRVAHTGRDFDQLHRVDVIDSPRLRVVARRHIVAAHDDDVANPQRRRPEKIGLQGQAVSVADRQLHDRLDATLRQQVRCRHRRQMHMGAGVVGAVDRVGHASQLVAVSSNRVGIRAIARGKFRGDDELPRAQQFREAANARHASPNPSGHTHHDH